MNIKKVGSADDWRFVLAEPDEEVLGKIVAASPELIKLTSSINDVLYMLKHIEEASQLPAFGQVHLQYIAMARELKKSFDAYLAELP